MGAGAGGCATDWRRRGSGACVAALGRTQLAGLLMPQFRCSACCSACRSACRCAVPAVPAALRCLQVLGERCMEYVPSSRPTMEEVLSGPPALLPARLLSLFPFASCGRTPPATVPLPLGRTRRHHLTLAEVNSILSDTMGILQQFLAASSAAATGGGGPRDVLGGTLASRLAPSDPFVEGG